METGQIGARILWNESPWRAESVDLPPGTPSLVHLDDDGRLDIVLSADAAIHWVPDQDRLETLWTPTSGVFVRATVGADLDGDGVDELAVATGQGQDVLLADLQTTQQLGTGAAFDSFWFDADNDRDMDLYVVNDRATEFGGNRFFRNNAGTLQDAECACELELDGMGGTWGDVDNDGLNDLFLTATRRTALLQGGPDGRFIDVTAAWGADPLDLAAGGNPMGWGAVLFDADNDGDLDVLMAQGSPGFPEPLNLGWNDGGAFRWEALDVGAFQNVAVRDLNGDGVLDIIATAADAPTRILVSDGCTDAAWLQVDAPVGSLVEVTTDGTTWRRTLRPESSYGAANTPLAHFGLGDVGRVERVTVTFPDGSQAQETDVTIRQLLSFKQD